MTEDKMVHGITDSMDMSLSKPLELVMDTEAWRPAGHGVPKSQTRLSNSLHSKDLVGKWFSHPLEVELRRHLTPFPRCPPHPSSHRSLHLKTTDWTTLLI